MFKNYHIVILTERAGEVKSLRVRGWVSACILFLVMVLIALNVFLWKYYVRSSGLEGQLLQVQEESKAHDIQLLGLGNKLVLLERDIERVSLFDTKLRMMMNIGEEQERSFEAGDGFASSAAFLTNSRILSRHRELYVKHAYALAEELAVQVSLEELEQQRLIDFMKNNTEVLLSTPSIWPARGILTSGFGWRVSSFTGRSQMHKGIDIANRVGTPVWAPARGIVTFAGSDGAYGLCLVIDHGNNITTRYAHLSKLHVKESQFVQRGEVIGAMGNSGRSTGPHLHYEVRIGGVPVNPMRYILN